MGNEEEGKEGEKGGLNIKEREQRDGVENQGSGEQRKGKRTDEKRRGWKGKGKLRE